MINNFLKLVVLNVLFLVTTFNSKAQQRTCGTMSVLETKMDQNSNLSKKMSELEQFTQECIERRRNNSARVEGIITIPVVVHVIYQTDQQNINDAQIFSQIEVLNKDFRRTNSDANNTWSQAADTQIQFCLASIDPNGNTTNGITRKFVDRSSWGTNDAMKKSSQGGVNPWATNSYLNMWVCNIGGGILGYAQFPGDDAATDGVVISPQFFGTTGTAQPPFNGGRTTTHEVGHWLNLRHIWGDGACGIDDFVSDTPTSDAANYGCATGHVSCGTIDMVQNYMDYSDDVCMNLFTQGQTERMRALFDPGGFRASLLNSNACSDDGTENPVATCTDGIQNQDETGVDCGGSCTPCSTNCPTNEIKITINFDNYPEETSWEITNEAGNVVAFGEPYIDLAEGSTLTITECIDDGCYNFTIKDAYQDGICCGYGNGSYSLTFNENNLTAGGIFTAEETTNLCLGLPKPTCEDGIQNQNEIGIDCGGPCVACPTCEDGIQNQAETGIDCGGPCTPCPIGCQNNEIELTITFDNYPEETSWEIINASEEVISSGGPYNTLSDGSTLNLNECLVDGCYSFVINDAYGDGICCGYGNGSYLLTSNVATLASGANFAATEISNFCFENSNENNCTNQIINSEDFETGWGIWNDGGSDAYRNNYALYASSGNYTIRIRDNSSTSFITSDNIDASNYNDLTVEFSYYPVELEDGEDFWLQLSTDGGATFNTIKTWVKGTDFNNSTAYSETVNINQAFSANTKIRFRVDASVNNDRVYFDDIIISGCQIN